MKPAPIALQCCECSQFFDLLNSPYRKPLANTKWLHATGSLHHNFVVLYDDDTRKTVRYKPSKKQKPMEYIHRGSTVVMLLKTDAERILKTLYGHDIQEYSSAVEILLDRIHTTRN